MKNFIIPLLFILAVVSLIALIYSIFAAIWGFNPTEINNFNLKLGISSLIWIILITAIIKEIEL